MKTIRNIIHLIFALLTFASLGLTPSARGGVNSANGGTLFDYSNSPILHDNYVAFPDPSSLLVVGDAISKSGDDTFVIDREGDYLVNWGIQCSDTMSGTFGLVLNGHRVGPTSRVFPSAPADVAQTMLVHAMAGDTVKLEIDSGGGILQIYVASIVIEKLR